MSSTSSRGFYLELTEILERLTANEELLLFHLHRLRIEREVLGKPTAGMTPEVVSPPSALLPYKTLVVAQSADVTPPLPQSHQPAAPMPKAEMAPQQMSHAAPANSEMPAAQVTSVPSAPMRHQATAASPHVASTTRQMPHTAAANSEMPNPQVSSARSATMHHLAVAPMPQTAMPKEAMASQQMTRTAPAYSEMPPVVPVTTTALPTTAPAPVASPPSHWPNSPDNDDAGASPVKRSYDYFAELDNSLAELAQRNQTQRRTE